jgi:hypothetical protein
MNKSRGVMDLMESKRYKPKHIAEELIKNDVPGNWKLYQNVHNLVCGYVVPKDAYIYIMLANLLDVDIKTILYRYSSKGSIGKESKSEDFDW